MKKGIFIAYVKLVCEGMNITNEELFSKTRNREVANARFILYYLCYERPMTVNQIVSLMYDEGYYISYESVRRGTQVISQKLNLKEDAYDKDFASFINDCLIKTEGCC